MNEDQADRRSSKKRFVPPEGARPLTPDEVSHWLFPLYAHQPDLFDRRAWACARQQGLDLFAEGDPRSLVVQAIVDLREKAGRYRRIYRTGPGLLLKQIEYTSMRLGQERRGGEIPAGAGGEVGEDELDDGRFCDLLGARLDASEHLAWERRRQSAAELELRAAASSGRFERVVARRRLELADDIRTGRVRLTPGHYVALRLAHANEKHRGARMPDAVRAAAKRGRKVLWPWAEPVLRSVLGERFTDPADHLERAAMLDALLARLRVFDDAFMKKAGFLETVGRTP